MHFISASVAQFVPSRLVSPALLHLHLLCKTDSSPFAELTSERGPKRASKRFNKTLLEVCTRRFDLIKSIGPRRRHSVASGS